MTMTKRIEGTVTQLIPPEKLDKYAMPTELYEQATGRYVAIVDEGRVGLLRRILSKTPFYRRDDCPILILDDPDFREGDTVELAVENYSYTKTIDAVYTPKRPYMCEDSDE